MTGKSAARDRARFVSPRATTPMVSRSRLDGRYQAATGRILVVSAPGGYGKSTIVSRWIDADDRQVCWIDVERIDNDPLVFSSALGRALGSDNDLVLDVRDPSGADVPLADRLVFAVGSMVAGADRPFVLVLDDVHLVDSDASIALIRAIAEHLPASSTLVLCGRAQRPGPVVGRLRLRPGVVEVSAQDLALDLTETAELVAALGLELDLDELTELNAQFEGWPAGIRLVGLVQLAHSVSVPASIADAGDAAYVVDYLRAEWVERIPADDLQLLREAACLERFTAAMCVEILGRRNAAEILSHLTREQLLLLPLDQRDEWFRMHPLLSRWLASDLRSSDLDRWKEIHVTASRWWAAEGDVDLAFGHARNAGDVAFCEQLASEHGAAYMTRGMWPTVERWLSAFETEQIQHSATLVTVLAGQAMHRGDGVAVTNWIGLLAELVEDDGGGAEARTQATLDALRAAASVAPASELIPMAERAITGLDGHGDVWWLTSCLALGSLAFLVGDDDRADEVLANGAFHAELAGIPTLHANLLGTRGAVRDRIGDRAFGADLTRQAVAILREHHASHLPTTAIVQAMSALVHAREGDRDRARALVTETREKLAHFEEISPWLNVVARLPLTNATILLDDRATSRRLLAELDGYLSSEPPDLAVRDHVEELRVAVERARHRPATGQASLTGAELNVLDYLPTNLSLGEIAARLYVSRNTVKTHVAAIYRKLGSTSRNEAVDLAVEFGIIERQITDHRD